MRVLITGGGTVEHIDAIRYITNISTGSLSTDLARLFADTGAEVHLLLGKYAREPEVFGATVERFSTCADLARRLESRLIGSGNPGHEDFDMVIHAAAVSDYAPREREGKIDSSPETLTLTLERNPKLIDRFRDWGGGIFAVGFKLTASGDPLELERKALDLLERAELDVVIGNDLTEIRSGNHRLIAFLPEGETREFHRTRLEDLRDFLLECRTS